MTRSLAQRNRQPEWMDQPDIDPALHEQALRGLERINRLSRSVQILWPEIRRLARESPGPVSVLDLGSGGGDVTIGLWQRARRDGLEVEVSGCDKSAVAVSHAREKAAAVGAAVEFLQGDVFELDPALRFDVVACSLFLHHQDAGHAVGLLREMACRARRLVLVNDLLRSRAGYALAWLATRVLTRSPVVHLDGPRSVAAAFTLREARELAEQAELHKARIERRWPLRYLLSWRKPA